MSNELAIAMVTATLRHLLHPVAVGSATVTTLPLDKARGTNTNSQLNIFLYHASINAPYRNQPMPGVQPNETGLPPLPLNLHYMITAYGQGNEDILAHRLLGNAISILHDHPLLGPADMQAAITDPIIAAIDPNLKDSDLAAQIERVRLTWQPLSLEDLSKLWGGFQTAYHLSAAYEAAVVLIESKRAAKTPLPVLTRGPGDAGVAAVGGLIPPYPTLDTILLPNKQTSARAGDILTLQGNHLSGATVNVQFTHPRLTALLPVPPLPGGSDTELTVQLPVAPAAWPAGIYAVSVIVTFPALPSGAAGPRATNELALALAPRLINPTPAPPDIDGNVTITVTCSPDVLPAQRASLLLGDREILAAPHAAPTNTLTFLVTAPVPGTYFIRLRVDGIDSLLVDARGAAPDFDPRKPIFDTTQQVTL